MIGLRQWIKAFDVVYHDLLIAKLQTRGVARIFQRGGHTESKLGYSPDCHYGQGIVMAFSPPVVDCLVKKGLQKGG